MNELDKGAGRTTGEPDGENEDEKRNPGQNAEATSGVGSDGTLHGGEASKKFPLDRESKIQAGTQRNSDHPPEGTSTV